jgi:DNA invertase Pin-like site-specific DNA recombinase
LTKSCGIHFRSLTEEINTSTLGGKLIFHIFAALAEFERGLIIERTRAGMKAARARGVRPGPKPKLSRTMPASLSRAASDARTWPARSK